MSGANSEPVADHERFMGRALELAERGRGSTLPNPMVGCVIVRDDEIVGEGWHERAGEPHAETNALRSAGERARGATVYVTLEPCAHHGRTPPCADALIEAGVRRVVIAWRDPNPVAKGGVERLVNAGILVVTGVLEDEARAQNEAFRVLVQGDRPFVLYKTAMTLDGKIATRSGRSRWITNPRSRERVQRWRSETDAVAVGVNTVLLDDPLLTARIAGGRTPRKVIFDSVARMPTNARLFEPDERGEAPRVVVFTTPAASSARVEALRERGADVRVIGANRGRSSVREALSALRGLGVSSLLLEGGGTLAWSFFEARSVDRVAWFIGPKLLGGGGATPLGGLGVTDMEDAILLTDVQSEWLDGDLLVTGGVHYREEGRAASVAGEGATTADAGVRNDALPAEAQ